MIAWAWSIFTPSTWRIQKAKILPHHISILFRRNTNFPVSYQRTSIWCQGATISKTHNKKNLKFYTGTYIHCIHAQKDRFQYWLKCKYTCNYKSNYRSDLVKHLWLVTTGAYICNYSSITYQTLFFFKPICNYIPHLAKKKCSKTDSRFFVYQIGEIKLQTTVFLYRQTHKRKIHTLQIKPKSSKRQYLGKNIYCCILAIRC